MQWYYIVIEIDNVYTDRASLKIIIFYIMHEILRYTCYIIMAIICDCGNDLKPAGSHHTVPHHVPYIKYLDVVN